MYQWKVQLNMTVGYYQLQPYVVFQDELICIFIMLNNYHCVKLTTHTVVFHYKADPTVLMDATGIDDA